MVSFNKISDNLYGVTTPGGIKIGELLREIDGFFVFYPENHGAAFPSEFMKFMAAKLDELNKEWSETIEKELGD
jgi:hypothetical protein